MKGGRGGGGKIGTICTTSSKVMKLQHQNSDLIFLYSS